MRIPPPSFRIPVLACALVVGIGTYALAKPQVVTFSKGDLARMMVEGCGPNAAPRRTVHAHRNTACNMLYFVSEDHQEAVIYAQTQQCNETSTDTLDVFRDDKGKAVAQLILKDERPMLMVGDFDPVRGKRFDVERSGQYVCISQGTSSTLSSIDRPYRTLYKLDLDAQRIFVRKRALVVVGGNPSTQRLEARVIRVERSGFTEEPPVSIASMPAGVRVLDYSEESDDLLLGGVDPSGQAAFVVYNIGNGQSYSVMPQKVGDDMAMFVSDSALRARLTGSSSSAKAADSGEKPTGAAKSGGLLKRAFGK